MVVNTGPFDTMKTHLITAEIKCVRKRAGDI